MEPTYRQFLSHGEMIGSRYALAAPRHVPLGLTGLQLGQRAGSSLEFKEHRDYQPGDDLRRIDWSAYARSDRLIVKLHREEINPHLDLILDGSRSMNLLDTPKAQAALTLAAAFASAASNTGYTHTAWLTGDHCDPIRQGNDRPAAWDDIDFSSRTPLHEALAATPPQWRTQGVRVLISDLLFLGDPLTVLDHLSHGASGVSVVQVLAEADVDPPQRGNVRLVDCETNELREVFIDAAAQQRYRRQLAAHQQNWHRAARQVGARMTTLIADRFIGTDDLTPLIQTEILL